MSDITFDPKTIFETYQQRVCARPKAQQEGVKALDRVGRYQYAVAGDYLEWSLAQAKAAIGAQSPARFRLQASRTHHGAQREAARPCRGVRQAGGRRADGFSEAVNEGVTKVAAETKRKAS